MSKGPVASAMVVVVGVMGPWPMLSGCHEQDTDRTTIFADDSIASWVAEHRWSIGGVDLRDAYALDGVRGVAFVDSGVVVADAGSREVRLFSALDGDSRWTVGGRGAGPGEFAAIGSIAAIDRSTVAVWDPELQRLTLVSAEGQVLRTTAPRLGETWSLFPTFVGALPGQRLVFRDVFPVQALRDKALGDRRDSIRFIVTEGLEGGVRAIVTALGSEAILWRDLSSEGTAWGTLSPIFGRSTFQAVAGDALVIAHNDSLEVKRFGDDGTLQLHVAYPHSSSAVSSSEVAAERARLLEEQRARIERRSSREPLALVNGRPLEEWTSAGLRDAIHRLPHRTTRTAFTQVHGDPFGRVWVAEHFQPGAGVRRWLVLDPSLRPLSHVELPAELEVLAVGAEGLVGLRRDELGVEISSFFDYSF